MNKILHKEFHDKFYDIMADYINNDIFENVCIRVETGGIVLKIEARPSRSDKGKISYLRNDKRMHLSVRRFLTRILHLNDHLSDVQLDGMAAKILESCQISDHKFEYLTGQKIQDAYKMRIGGSSCMTGDCNEYVGLYRDNPDKIKLAVVRYNRSSARCVIWLGDDKKLYYDRIYTDSKYCNEILIKELSDRDVIKIYECDVPVTVSDLNYTRGEIPYLDTMRYGTFLNGKLKLTSGSVSGEYDEVLQGQHGNGESEHNCNNCGDGIDGEDIYSACDELYCEHCYSENFEICEHCNETHHNNNLTYVDSSSITYCDECLSEECFTCDTCDEIFHRDEINCIDNQEDICNTCYNKNYTECIVCKETFYNDDIDGKMCKDCAANNIVCSKCDVVSDKYIADGGICATCNGLFCNV